MIRLRDVAFTYENGAKDKDISNIDLWVKKGEVVLLCGESVLLQLKLENPRFKVSGLRSGAISGEIISKLLSRSPAGGEGGTAAPSPSPLSGSADWGRADRVAQRPRRGLDLVGPAPICYQRCGVLRHGLLTSL